jgi:hypothetical protein
MVELQFGDSETLEDLGTYVARARTLDSDGAIGSCLRGIRPGLPDTRVCAGVSPWSLDPAVHRDWSRPGALTGEHHEGGDRCQGHPHELEHADVRAERVVHRGEHRACRRDPQNAPEDVGHLQ